MLRPHWPKRRLPPKLRALQPATRQRQSLLRDWRNLSYQWALRDSVWGVLQWRLYRQYLQVGGLPYILHLGWVLCCQYVSGQANFVLGDENWVVECHGSVVNNGDFCCSVNGTITTCCNTASNGLGLVAPVSSAQAVSATFVGGSIVPTSSISGVIASSFGNFPTTCPNIRACFPPPAQILGLISHYLRKYQGLHGNSWQVL